MSRQVNPALIGAFVVGALVLVIIAIALLGGGFFGNRKVSYVAYFEGSVNGLSVGAPVKMKGVQIGTVTDIVVQFYADQAVVRTPVFVEVEPDKVVRVGGGRRPEVPDIPALVQQGLRAQLKLSSVVTGQLYIEVDFRPDTPIRLVGGGDTDITEVPTIPSSVEEFEHTISATVSEIRGLPLAEIFNAMLHTLQQIDALVHSKELTGSARALENTLLRMEKLSAQLDRQLGSVSSELGGFLSDSRQLVRDVRSELFPLAASTQETLVAVRRVAERAETGITAIETLTDPDSASRESVSGVLRELAKASRAVAQLSDYLQRHPEALLYGKQGD